jgi:hypothetical protein
MPDYICNSVATAILAPVARAGSLHPLESDWCRFEYLKLRLSCLNLIARLKMLEDCDLLILGTQCFSLKESMFLFLFAGFCGFDGFGVSNWPFLHEQARGLFLQLFVLFSIVFTWQLYVRLVELTF